MPKTSLYVGNLHPKVDDEDLYEAFRHIGKIVSVKVCPSGYGEALGYGFVNFERKRDAEKALGRLNLERLFGRPMRISRLKRGWSEKAERESRANGNLVVDGMAVPGVEPKEVSPRDDVKEEENDGEQHCPNPETNVYVKNIAELLDDDALHRIFEPFGAIKDCSIALDSEGVSKGFGFVEFETADSSEIAVQRMDGELIPGVVNSERRLSVCLAKTMEQGNAQIVEEIAQKGTQQLAEISSKKVFSVFVTGFGATLYNCGLRKLFEKFGPIYKSLAIRDTKGRSKGFGFVDFESEYDAENAIRTMAGTLVPGLPEANKLVVERNVKKWGTPICKISPAAAGKKSGYIVAGQTSNTPEKNPSLPLPPPPHHQLQQQPPPFAEEPAQNRVQRLAEASSKKVYSVFVAKFGYALDNCGLYKLFEEFGPIYNAMVMEDAKGSMGFGFVEFEREGDAENAIRAMEGTPAPGRPASVKLVVIRGENKWGTPICQFPPAAAGEKSRYILGQTSNAPEKNPSFPPIAEEITKKETQKLAETSPKKVYSVFVANFGYALDNCGLFKMFEKFGPIYNAMVMRDSKGRSKGYGFVEFERKRDAKDAIKAMAGTPVPGLPAATKLVVCRDENIWGEPFTPIPPDPVEENSSAASTQTHQRLAEASQKVGYQLFVANFGAALDDRGLCKLFEKFGSIIKSSMKKDANGSMGYGFVVFERERDAENAIRTMAGTPAPGRPASIKLAVKRSNKQWGPAPSHQFSPAVDEPCSSGFFSGSSPSLPSPPHQMPSPPGPHPPSFHWVEVSGRGFRDRVIDDRVLRFLALFERNFRERFGADSIRERRLSGESPDRLQLNFANEALANEAVALLNSPDNQSVRIRASRWFDPYDLNPNKTAMQMMMADRIPPQKVSGENEEDRFRRKAASRLLLHLLRSGAKRKPRSSQLGVSIDRRGNKLAEQSLPVL